MLWIQFVPGVTTGRFVNPAGNIVSASPDILRATADYALRTGVFSSENLIADLFALDGPDTYPFTVFFYFMISTNFFEGDCEKLSQFFDFVLWTYQYAKSV
jgi:hypothetical protein